MTSHLVVRAPRGSEPEREYAIGVVLGDFLGLEYRLVPGESGVTRIELEGDPSRSLLVHDAFFPNLAEGRNGRESVQPAAEYWPSAKEQSAAPLTSPGLPVIFGAPGRGTGSWWSTDEKGLSLGIDIFGSAFYLLTRYEEEGLAGGDEHDRFRALDSLAARVNFLDRPLVDEYVELLWAAVHRLWPALPRRVWPYSVYLSHDVDRPLAHVAKAPLRLARSTAADVVYRHDPALAAKRLRSYVQSFYGNTENDPNNTFDYIASQSESRGLTSSFYFLTTGTSEFDGGYSITSSWIRRLMRRLARRGHIVGLHGSYRSFDQPDMLRREFEALVESATAVGIEQSRWGGRQHYLRWRNPATWQAWEEAGLDYDSTVGFADRVGFRCGTCRPFPVFNLDTRRRLRLVERPLVVMDRTMARYMKLADEEAIEIVAGLAGKCRTVGGELGILWHNDLVLSLGQRRLYESVLDAATGKS